MSSISIVVWGSILFKSDLPIFPEFPNTEHFGFARGLPNMLDEFGNKTFIDVLLGNCCH